ARGANSEIDVRTDLWAVGATMFTLCSARLVHEATDVKSALAAATSEPAPSLASAAPDMPMEIVDLVDYALSVKNDVRWPSASMMRIAVRRAFARTKRQSERL